MPCLVSVGRIRMCAFALLAAFLCRGDAHAQESFAPIRASDSARYRFDLRRNFFATPELAAADRRALIDAAGRLSARLDQEPTAAELLKTLTSADSLMRGAGRQYAWLTLRPSIDTRDREAQAEMNELAAAVEPASAAVERRLATLAPRFDSLARAEPRLARYRYAVDRARRNAQHRLDAAGERALGPVEYEAATWGPALFRRTVASIDFGSVETPAGRLDVRTQGNQIRNHPDRSVRERGYELNTRGLLSRVDTFALILTRTATLRDSIARVRRWPDYPTQMYAGSELTPRFVRSLLEQVFRRAEMHRAWERRRIAAIGRALGVDTVRIWDLSAPAPGQVVPRFTIQEASAAILASVAPLGDAYVREMRALLDPANGRLDLVARPNRVERPGFSTGSVGYPSMFFQGRFEGYIEDVLILAHEAGHAVQNMLMDSAGVLPRYAMGPSFFTESFATLNEVLLLDHLQRTAATKAQQDFYRGQLIENALGLFRNNYESSIELQLYDSVAAGRMLDAAGIERLTMATGARASVWFGEQGIRRDAWLQPIQFYTWPLYRVNYSIARILALRYHALLIADPAAFASRYGALLRSGYDAPPNELLRRHLGFDLTDTDALVGAALGVVAGWID